MTRGRWAIVAIVVIVVFAALVYRANSEQQLLDCMGEKVAPDEPCL